MSASPPLGCRQIETVIVQVWVKAMMAYMPDEYVEQIVAVKACEICFYHNTTLEELKEELAGP